MNQARESEMRAGPPQDELTEPLWVSQLMDMHTELAKKLSTIAVTSIALSIAAMCALGLYMRLSGNTRLVLIGFLAGLWFGAFSAGVLWVFMRPSKGEDIPVVLPPGYAALVTGVFMAPRLLAEDIMRWRDMTSRLRTNRHYAAVREYLRDDLTHVVAHLVAALGVYLLVSAVLLVLIWVR